MTTLLQHIKSHQLSARKERDVLCSDLLTTLYSEAYMVGKTKGNRDSTDEEVLGVIRKFISNNEATLSTPGISPDQAYKLARENSVLRLYLPLQLTAEKIEELVGEYSASTETPNLGGFMSYLKNNYPGQYDGKVASEVARRAL